MTDYAVLLRPIQATGGGGGQVNSSANQKVSRCRITAAFHAAVWGGGQLLSHNWKNLRGHRQEVEVISCVF